MKNFPTFLSMFPVGLSLLFLASCASSRKVAHDQELIPGIHITFTGDQVADTVFVTTAPIPADTSLYVMDYLEVRDNGLKKAYPVKDGSVHIPPESVPSIYKLQCDYYALSSYYMRNTDHLELTVNSLGPLDFKVSGGIYSNKIPFSDAFGKLRSKLYRLGRDRLTENELDSLSSEMNSLIDKIMAVSDPEIATYAIPMLEDDFVTYAFDRLPAGAENTLYYTYACARRNSARRTEDSKKMLEQSIETSAPVPEITFTGLDGQTFDLSSLRGKWVVVDFWASWCAPCRRGFEKMKPIYAENSDRLEVVAIACGDHEENWRKAINDLELPWINLLAPSPDVGDGTVAGFPVAAYPTKILIDPEGRLCDYIVGETDDFYQKLLTFLHK